MSSYEHNTSYIYIDMSINYIIHVYLHATILYTTSTYTSSCTYITYCMYIFMHTYHMRHVYLHVNILYTQCIHAMYLVIYDHMQHHILYIIDYIRYLIYYIVYTICYILSTIYYILCFRYYILLKYMVYHI